MIFSYFKKIFKEISDEFSIDVSKQTLRLNSSNSKGSFEDRKCPENLVNMRLELIHEVQVRVNLRFSLTQDCKRTRFRLIYQV